jgi:hypothetical protein
MEWLPDPILIDDGSGTVPGSYSDFDISAYVPAACTVAIFRITNTNTVNAHAFAMRAKGSSDNLHAHIASKDTITRCCGLNSNKEFQTKGQGTTFWIYLVGWFTADAGWLLDAEELPTAVSVGRWHIVNIPQIPRDAVMAIVEMSPGGITDVNNMRMVGSTDNRYGSYCAGAVQYFIGMTTITSLGGGRYCSYRKEVAGIKFWIRGYIRYGKPRLIGADVTPYDSDAVGNWKTVAFDELGELQEWTNGDFDVPYGCRAVIIEPWFDSDLLSSSAPSWKQRFDWHSDDAGSATEAIYQNYDFFFQHSGHQIVGLSSDNKIKLKKGHPYVKGYVVGYLYGETQISEYSSALANNFVFGYDFLGASSITSDNEDSDYPIDNVLLEESPQIQFRNSSAASATNIVIDLGAVKSIVALALYDVNFGNVIIEGNNTDSWGSPAFSQAYTITLDERTNRYKLCTILDNFSFRYIRVVIGAGETILDSLSVHRIGSIIVVDSVVALSKQFSYGYEYRVDSEVKENVFECGGVEKINAGAVKWEARFTWDPNLKQNEAEVWTINGITKDKLLIFFENTEADKVYLCHRFTPIKLKYDTPKTVRIPSFEFKENY